METFQVRLVKSLKNILSFHTSAYKLVSHLFLGKLTAPKGLPNKLADIDVEPELEFSGAWNNRESKLMDKKVI